MSDMIMFSLSELDVLEAKDLAAPVVVVVVFDLLSSL